MAQLVPLNKRSKKAQKEYHDKQLAALLENFEKEPGCRIRRHYPATEVPGVSGSHPAEQEQKGQRQVQEKSSLIRFDVRHTLKLTKIGKRPIGYISTIRGKAISGCSIQPKQKPNGKGEKNHV